MQITGALRTDGQIQIDGIVNGDIAAHSITVGQSGTVIGRLVATEIHIWGTVHGEVDGEMITLGRTARGNAEYLERAVTNLVDHMRPTLAFTGN